MFSPGCNRPVWSDVSTTPVELDNVALLLSRLERLWFHLVCSLFKGVNGGRANNANTVKQVLLVALDRVGAGFPSVRCHKHVLFDF